MGMEIFCTVKNWDEQEFYYIRNHLVGYFKIDIDSGIKEVCALIDKKNNNILEDINKLWDITLSLCSNYLVNSDYFGYNELAHLIQHSADNFNFGNYITKHSENDITTLKINLGKLADDLPLEKIEVTQSHYSTSNIIRAIKEHVIFLSYFSLKWLTEKEETIPFKDLSDFYIDILETNDVSEKQYRDKLRPKFKSFIESQGSEKVIYNLFVSGDDFHTSTGPYTSLKLYNFAAPLFLNIIYNWSTCPLNVQNTDIDNNNDNSKNTINIANLLYFIKSLKEKVIDYCLPADRLIEYKEKNKISFNDDKLINRYLLEKVFNFSLICNLSRISTDKYKENRKDAKCIKETNKKKDEYTEMHTYEYASLHSYIGFEEILRCFSSFIYLPNAFSRDLFFNLALNSFPLFSSKDKMKNILEANEAINKWQYDINRLIRDLTTKTFPAFELCFSVLMYHYFRSKFTPNHHECTIKGKEILKEYFSNNPIMDYTDYWLDSLNYWYNSSYTSNEKYNKSKRDYASYLLNNNNKELDFLAQFFYKIIKTSDYLNIDYHK